MLGDPAMKSALQSNAAAGGSGSWNDVETPANGNADLTINSSVQYGSEITLAAGTATKARLYISTFDANAGIKMALYSGTHSDGVLVANGAETITGTGYVEVTFNTPAVISAGTHTIWFTVDTTTLTFRENNSDGSFYFAVDTSYPDPPPNLSLGSSLGAKIVTSVFVQ